MAFRDITTLAYIVHVGAGTLGLVSGMVAAFAAYLGVVVPDHINIFIATFTAYLVATAWLTVRRKEGTTGLAEKIAFALAIALCAPFAILSFQLVLGLPPLFTSTVALKGPVLVAIYVFTSVLVIAAIGDARVVPGGGISGAPRIARHLWRMCLGLTLATGSAFTNGLPRLLPASLHVPPLVFFLPQLVPLGLLVFWMARMRFTGKPGALG